MKRGKPRETGQALAALYAVRRAEPQRRSGMRTNERCELGIKLLLVLVLVLVEESGISRTRTMCCPFYRKGVSNRAAPSRKRMGILRLSISFNVTCCAWLRLASKSFARFCARSAS